MHTEYTVTTMSRCRYCYYFYNTVGVVGVVGVGGWVGGGGVNKHTAVVLQMHLPQALLRQLHDMQHSMLSGVA